MTDTKPFPMLAAAADLKRVQYPVLGFPKVDGIRAVIHDKQPLSRKLLTLPNQFIQGFFNHGQYQGLDGELTVGAANDPLCIKHSTSGVMSRAGEPDFYFHVFDKWDEKGSYEKRLAKAAMKVSAIGSVRVVPMMGRLLEREDDLLAYEAGVLNEGFEGLILRDPSGAYKHGRSTVREGGMLKIKRFEDSEAIVLNVVEEQFNGNEAMKDNLGRTKRSSSKANKSGKGRMGTLMVRDIHHGWEFEIGTGFNDSDKQWWWEQHTAGKAANLLVKYKYFPVGMQDKPRHPVFLTLRDARDL